MQTNSDGGGHFTFLDVPAGTYQLSPPHDWLSADIRTGIGLTTVVAIDKLDRRYDRRNAKGWECSRDITDGWFKCGIEYKVDYGPMRRARPSAMMLGLIEENIPGGWKLAGAKVLLTSVRDPARHYSAVSDNDGHFRIAPVAGVYVLAMSRPGFLDVYVPDFFVPQENDTLVTIRTDNDPPHALCE